MIIFLIVINILLVLIIEKTRSSKNEVEENYNNMKKISDKDVENMEKKIERKIIETETKKEYIQDNQQKYNMLVSKLDNIKDLKFRKNMLFYVWLSKLFYAILIILVLYVMILWSQNLVSYKFFLEKKTYLENIFNLILSIPSEIQNFTNNLMTQLINYLRPRLFGITTTTTTTAQQNQQQEFNQQSLKDPPTKILYLNRIPIVGTNYFNDEYQPQNEEKFRNFAFSLLMFMFLVKLYTQKHFQSMYEDVVF